GAGYTAGLLLVFSRQKVCIDWNEGGGKCTFTENILQEVRNPERRIKCIGGERNPEVITENPLPDHADDAANQNAGAHHERGLARAFLLTAFNGRRPGELTRGFADHIDSFTGYFGSRAADVQTF